MKKIFFIVLIIVGNSFSIFALLDLPAKVDSTKQTKREVNKNLIFSELGGNGLGFTLNYERYINDNISLRIGLGSDIYFRSTFIPLLLNFTFNKPFELGVGMVVYNFSKGYNLGDILGRKFNKKESGVLITSVVGFKNRIKSVLIKFSFTPVYEPVSSEFQLYGGLSFGIAF